MNILTKEGYLINKSNYTEKQLNKIKADLTVTPHQSFKIGNNLKPESFTVYDENDTFLSIPKFYGLEKLGIPEENKEIIGEVVDIIFKGTLRPKQSNIINTIFPKLEQNDGGLLCLGCGQGKTLLALYIATLFKVKTLVIVHKSFLLNQWVQRAKEFTNANIGIIQQNKIDINDKQIVIGMLQSIAKDKYDSDIFRDFGLVIFDEAHHAPSKYFSRSLPIIACKKTLALSATPKRSDKLEKVLYWYFGPILYQEAAETLNTLQVKVYKYNIVHKNFKEYKLYDGSINRAKTINKLTEIDKRNIFIIEQIKEILLDEGRKLIVLSDRVNHLNQLKELLDKLEITTTSFYIGGMKQKKLDESEKAQVIFGTYSMASEALDIPELNTLVMTTPRKEIEQTVGRITRKKDHIVYPLIIDIVDNLSSFNRQGDLRKKFYNKKEFQVSIYYVEENEIKEQEIDDFIKDNSLNNNGQNNNEDNFID
jgi:superfamily II DNA or RNA helicase